MTTPRVSILICSHNGARTMGAAIESALAQVKKCEFEIVIIDDGSTDNTHEMARAYVGKENVKSAKRVHISLMRLPGNKGLPFACNEGLKLARGEYFTRLDDDDMFLPDAIGLMCDQLGPGKSDWSYCDRLIVDTKTGLAKRFNVGTVSSGYWLPRLSACGVMMRRDLVVSLGGYRPIFWHEYDLYMRYLEYANRKPHYLQEAVYVCGGHAGGPSFATLEMISGWKELADVWGSEKLRSHGFVEFTGSGDAA